MLLVKKTIVWSLCLLLGFSLSLSGTGEVFCVSDEGHNKIEPAHLEHCCDDNVSGEEAPLNEEDAHSDCVVCSDFEVDTPKIFKRTKDFSVSLLVTGALPASCLTLVINSASQAGSEVYALDQSHRLTEPTRTISILLC